MNGAAASMALMLCTGTGNTAVQEAARYLGQPLWALLRMRTRDLIDALPPGMEHVAEILARNRGPQQAHAARLLEELSRIGAQAFIPGEMGYPQALRASLRQNAPALLTILGDPALLSEPAVAIVGARHVSHYGVELAAACARVFCSAGIPVVSGGARGVDAAAHAAALAAGGKTVVVLAQGLLTYQAPKEIYSAQAEGRAVLVSQFMPDAPWASHAAVARNDTISALARLICVIEPKKTGGSIRTARCAIAQGKRLLLYCSGETSAGIPEPWARAGALHLLDAEGHFSAPRLLELWASAPPPPKGQGDLFEHTSQPKARYA